MQKCFKFGIIIVAVGILVAGVVASMNFGAMSTEAQTTIHINQTVNGTTIAGNTTGNMTKGNNFNANIRRPITSMTIT